MADGEVKIDTKLDTSGIDKGIKDLKGKLDTAGNSIDAGAKKSKGFADSLKGISTKAIASAGAVAGVAVAVKKTVDALNDCEAAYKVQRNAEIALQQAAKNNPYLNDESVYNLRNFASELQSMTNIGDEQSLQVMAQLAAMGRTEEQIQAIMKAAADMSAVTGNSIQNIAVQLNKTYSGLAGELGEANSAIRALTKEELEAGKAIDIIAQQYNGQAAAMADNTVQLANAWGDFKENIGRGWSKVTQPVKKFFLDVLSSINEVTAKTNDLSDAAKNRGSSLSTAAQTKLLLDEQTRRLSELQKMSALNDKMRADSSAFMKLSEQEQRSYTEFMAKTSTEEIHDEMSRLKDEVRALTIEYGRLSTAEKTAAEAAARAASEAEKKAATEAREKAAAEYIAANTKAIEEQVAAMELRAEISGEEIDAGEMYNAYMQSYIDLITKSNGLVTENNTAAKNRLATLQEWAQKAADAATEEERLNAALKAQEEAEKLLQEVKGLKNLSYFDEYAKKQEELKQLTEEVNNNEVLSEQQKADAMLEIDEAYAQNKKDLFNNITQEVNGYIQQTADIAKEAGDLMLENVKTESELELAELEGKYSKGEISEEEYYEKQKQIQQKAAREEYKIKMFQWSASLLSATANIAEGVTKAIAQGGTAGIITGALVGAAGAVNIASIIASKPTPPQFREGGVIGGFSGASYGADNIDIRARRGEMILNAYQQRSLWNKINGQSDSTGAGLNLTVNNTQSNRVDTSIREQNGEVYIDIIDKHINKGFSDGTYDAGFAAMNSRQEGVRIL